MNLIPRINQILAVFILLTATVMASQIIPASASPLTTLAAPIILDKTLRPGSTFSINITISEAQKLWGYQFILSYNTSVLTAVDYGFYSPFTLPAPSEINDTAGYVALAASSHMGDPNGFTTVDPLPIARIDFVVDAKGQSVLDLHDTVLADVYGTWIDHMVADGFFANTHVKIPDIPVTSVTLPEPPSNSSSEVVSIPQSAESSAQQSYPHWYVTGFLNDTNTATGVSSKTHVYKNYISSAYDWISFHIALTRLNATHMEWLEVGSYQNKTGFYLYAVSGLLERLTGKVKRYEPTPDFPTVALSDHSLEIVETSTETFEARIDTNTLKTYTFSYVHGNRDYRAEGESTNNGTSTSRGNSLRGHFWNLKWRDSSGVWHLWQQVQLAPAQAPYWVFFPSLSNDNFYTLGGGFQGDVNADGKVDIADRGEISAHWSIPQGPLGYDSNSDINGGADPHTGQVVIGTPDGYADIADIALVSAYWSGPPKGPMDP